MKSKGMMLCLILAIGCTAVAGQDAMKSTKKEAAKSKPAAMPMPTPSPEMMKMIKAMSGTWTVTEKHYPNPMMPNGGTGKGTAVLTAGPGNLSLVEKYHSSGAMGGSFNGMGVFWWDPKVQAYQGLWCDSVTPNGCASGGTTKWEGDNLVGTMEADMGGQKMVSRFTYSDWKPNSFVMTMEMGSDPKSLTKAMTITYTKGATTAKMDKPAQ